MNKKILVGAFVVMCVCGFLLTPAGLETRPIGALRSLAFLPLFLSSTALDFVALGLMIFRKPRPAALCGIIAAIEYVFLVPLDHARVFFADLPLPRGISIDELVVLVPSVVVLLLGPAIRREA